MDDQDESNFRELIKKLGITDISEDKPLKEDEEPMQYIFTEEPKTFSDDIGNTDLHEASAKGDYETVMKLLYLKNADISKENKLKETALHIAARHSHILILKQLVNHAQRIFTGQFLGESIFHNAIKKHDQETLLLIIKGGADLNSRDITGNTLLHFAIFFDWFEGAKLLLDNGIDLNIPNKTFYMPLHIACEKGDCRFINLLLQFKADVQGGIEKYSLTPLHIACKSGNENIVEILLENKANVEAEYEHITPLFFAVTSGNLNIVKMLVNKGATINTTLIYTWDSSPLEEAVYRGHYDIVKFLIKNKADIQCRYPYRKTVLFHKVVSKGNLEIVKLFLDSGADLECLSDSNETPLFIATSNGHFEVAKELVCRGAKINIVCRGSTPLLQAIKSRNVELSKFLIENDAQINYRDEDDGIMPLHLSVKIGNINLVQILLDRQAFIDCRTLKYGTTPLMYAILFGHTDIAQLLLDHGADASLQTRQNLTALHIACQKGNVEIVKHLLKRKVDVELKNHEHLTALHFAAKHGHTEVIKILLDNNAFIDVTAKVGETPLFYSIKHSQIEAALLFINRGSKVNCVGSDCVPLLAASQLRQQEVVNLLLKRTNLNVNYKNSLGMTVLFTEILWQHLENVRLLIAKGSDVNLNTIKGTPLQVACKIGNIEIIKLLIEAGADVNVDSNYGTPLFIACQEGHTDVVKLLLVISDSTQVTNALRGVIYKSNEINENIAKLLIESKADVNCNVNDEKPPLFYAIEKGWSSLIKLLLDYGVSPNSIFDGVTALNAAILKENIDIIQILLNYKANVNDACYTKFNRTSLFLAVVKENVNIVRVLIENGCDVNFEDSEGCTPLFAACSSPVNVESCIKIVNLLILNKANVEHKNKLGETPIFLAVKNKNWKVIKILLGNKANLINVRNKSGETPLEIAKAMNFSDITEVLRDT